jgi:glutathione S-transferase
MALQRARLVHTMILHFHPFASFCQKVLIGLYELEIPFERNVVHLEKPEERDALAKLWPFAKFPVIEDGGKVVGESTIILEYLAGNRLIPEDPERALECRLRDRFFDLYVADPMSKIVTDKLRPEGHRDGFGVEEARKQLATAYRVADDWLAGHQWAVGDTFTMADCAAAPALFYANIVLPFGDFRNVAAYFARLEKRPSYARVRAEAEPYMKLFPG